MRVSVKEPVLEHHLEDDPGRSLSQRGAVDAGRVKRGQVVDFHAMDALQCEHTRSCCFPEDAWDMHSRVAREVRGEALGAVALADVIQLGSQCLGELLRQPDQVIVIGEFPAATRCGRQILEDGQILFDLLHDTGPPHLDDDFSAVEQCRGMGLAN